MRPKRSILPPPFSPARLESKPVGNKKKPHFRGAK
jgi:hypothetical protein